jgi:hypothetical protein
VSRVPRYVGLIAAALSLSTAALAPAAEPLPRMLSIEWRRGPSLPQGLQDSDGGIVDGWLVSAGGFCSGQQGVPGKPDTYPRGFLRRAMGLELDRPAAGWVDLPDLPGAPRQGLDAAVAEGSILLWGGFSYDAPFTYREAHRLSRADGGWTWTALPDLPWPILGGGSCVVGSKVYLLGGADYDTTQFYTETDRTKTVARMGARLLELGAADAAPVWRERAPCPGTPRYVHAVAAAGGMIYCLGGATGSDNAAGTTCTVVDNWRYDPAADRWQPLADLPVASGNFPSGAIVYRDRYLLLVGGYQYGTVLNPDGTTRPAYGMPTRHDPANAMCSDVFVYDTHAGAFGSADPLPLNNNLPMTVVAGDRIHLLGGEIGGATIEGETFGHHPDLYLVGTIRPAGE